MISIKEAVKDIILEDDEILHAFCRKVLNLSAYAKTIQKEVEKRTFKDVGVQGIVVALSRIQKELGGNNPLFSDIVIDNISTKSPLSELVFEKDSKVLGNLSTLYKKVDTAGDDFLTMTLSTSEITIICSERLKDKVLKTLQSEPRMIQDNLASLGLTFDPKYYELPNVGYSFMRKVAQKRIVLAEVVSTHTEMIFIFHKKDLSEILGVFSK